MPRVSIDYSPVLLGYIKECFILLGRDLTTCELCGKHLKKPEFHHTKYDGATIYDLMVVCHSCNMLGENRNLQ